MNSMTLDKLFDHITRCVAHPHTAIVEHDKKRAIQIFIYIQKYLLDYEEDQENEESFGTWVDSTHLQFGEYAKEQLDILEGNQKKIDKAVN